MRITYEDAMQIQTDFEGQPPEEDSVTNISLLNDKPDRHYGTVAATDNEDPPVIESNSLTSLFAVLKKTPFVTVFTNLSSKAIPMALSFTFSFEVFLALTLLQIMSESEEDTAAAGLVSTMMNFVCTLATLPLFAASMDLSKKIGRWREARKTELELEEIAEESIQELSLAATKELEKEKIEVVNINTLLLGTGLTVLAFPSLYYSNFILTFVLHQGSAVARSAQQFLRPYAFAVPGLMARMSFEQIIFSFGKTKSAMWMALASFSIGASLSILLGFGKLGFPEMRQKGVALGFVVESYLTALSYGLFVKFSKECREFDFYKVSIDRVRRNLDNLLDIVRMGMMIDFTAAIELLLTLSVVVFSGLLGTEQEAAMSYCMQFISFEFIILAAFGFSCAQEMSRKLGAKNFIVAADIARYGPLSSLIYVAPLPILFSAYPKALEFISGGATKEVSKTLKTLVPIMSLGVILDAIRFNLLQQFRALDDFFVTSIIAFLGLSSGILLAAVLGFKTPLGIDGVGMGYTLGIMITAVLLGLRWKTKIAEVVAVGIENNTPLEPALSEKPSLWNSVSSFFHFGGNSSSVQAQADIMEARSIFEPC